MVSKEIHSVYGIRIEVHTSFESCASLLRAFLRAQKTSNVFMSVEWLEAWWKYIGFGKFLEILLVWEEEHLIGYIPLYYKKIKLTNIRQYFFIGHRTSNRIEICAKEGQESSVLMAAINYFEQLRCPVLLHLIDINSASPSFQILNKYLPCTKGIQGSAFPLYPCPHAKLSDDWETFFRTVVPKSKKRTELRKFERKLSSLGKVSFTVVTNPDVLKVVFPRMVQIHTARFRKTTNKSMEGVQKRFIEEISFKLLGHGLHISMVTLDDELISFVIGAKIGETFVDCIPAFDPIFQKFSLGHVHLMYLMQSLISERFKIFDFSKGDDIYKRKWANGETWNYLFVFNINPDFISRLYLWCKQKMLKVFLWGRKNGYNAKLKKVVGSFAWYLSSFQKLRPQGANRTCRISTQPHSSGAYPELEQFQNQENQIHPFSYGLIKCLPDDAKEFLLKYRYENSNTTMWVHWSSEHCVTVYNPSKAERIEIQLGPTKGREKR